MLLVCGKMKDLDILNQLYNGLHLEDEDLERAIKLLYLLNVELKSRVKYPKIKSLTLTKVYPKSEVNKK